MDVMAMQIAQILVAMLLQQEHSVYTKSQKDSSIEIAKNMQSAVGAIPEEIQPITEITMYMRYEDESLYGEIEQNKHSEGDDSEGDLRG